jgi:hypothetical protein
MASRRAAGTLTQLLLQSRSSLGGSAATSCKRLPEGLGSRLLLHGTTNQASSARVALSFFGPSSEASHAQVIRGLTSSASVFGRLVEILRDEIKHEKENYAKPGEIAAGPPAPFTLSESSDGDTLLTLVRASGRSSN